LARIAKKITYSTGPFLDDSDFCKSQAKIAKTVAGTNDERAFTCCIHPAPSESVVGSPVGGGVNSKADSLGGPPVGWLLGAGGAGGGGRMEQVQPMAVSKERTIATKLARLLKRGPKSKSHCFSPASPDQ
jgi:hypothetical protein